MKTITKLTKEQEARIPEWVDKWIKIGLKTGKTDWDTFDKYMPICYEKAKLQYPPRVIRVNSPIVGALASSIASMIINKNGAVRDAVDGAVRIAVRDAVRIAVGDAVGIAVRDAVDGAVGIAVRDAVDGAVRIAVRDAVDGAVRMKALSWHYWLGGQFWVGYWWGSPSCVSFFIDVCGIELSKDIMERAEAYRKVCESVNYIWPNKDFVIVCSRPKQICRNKRGQLHNIRGKSIEYPDGWGLYHLNGVNFDEELFKKVTSGKMPFEEILAIKDVDQRTQALRFGDVEKFIEHAKGKLLDKYVKLDTNGGVVGYKLYMIPKGDIFTEDAYYMYFDCPSTGKKHMEGVEKANTVAEAMAWAESNELYAMTPDEWKQRIPLKEEV